MAITIMLSDPKVHNLIRDYLSTRAKVDDINVAANILFKDAMFRKHVATFIPRMFNREAVENILIDIGETLGYSYSVNEVRVFKDGSKSVMFTVSKI